MDILTFYKKDLGPATTPAVAGLTAASAVVIEETLVKLYSEGPWCSRGW